MHPYDQLRRSISRGWNTWNTRSVLSHVQLPSGFAINLGIKEYQCGYHLTEALIGRQGADVEEILPGAHAYDGSYTALTLRWRGVECTVRTAHDGDDLVMMITTARNQRKPALLVVESAMLWNRPGMLFRQGNTLRADLPDGRMNVYLHGKIAEDVLVNTRTPYLCAETTQPIGISTGTPRSIVEIEAILDREETRLSARAARYGEHAECWQAMQTCLAWDTIYEPKKNRVITPVSRIWNCSHGGYVLFCWDTYFAAMMTALDHRELAYMNAIEITQEHMPEGFVPNMAEGTGASTRDRSQPPVGSLAALTIYRRYRETWFLEMLYDDLLAWNRWFAAHRTLPDGTLTWGSDPYQPVTGNVWETEGVNDRYGAALESGLDNSPMYDDIPFDHERHLLMLSDAGLTGLFIMDCECLAEIAHILGRKEEAELLSRAASTRAALATLWDEESGIYLNRNLTDGSFSSRLSPTNFYALFSGYVTEHQLHRMIGEHLHNPAEFGGEWGLPSIARNDPAYPDQNYWRGRIWAPMNFLVYLALRRHGSNEACVARRQLAEMSERLILKEWRSHRHVHENYCAETGEGCNVGNSDRFYHWGGLLSLIALMEWSDDGQA